MVAGVDPKLAFLPEGLTKVAPTVDYITFIDISTDPADPRIEKSFEMANSIFGPPTNLAISPDGRLALVANSVNWVETDGVWNNEPNREIYVFDLSGEPTHIDTIE